MGMAAITLLFFFSLLHPMLLYCSEEEESSAGICPHFQCGNIGNIHYPFTNTTRPVSCGPFVVEGCDKNAQTIQLVRGGKRYDLERILQDDTILIIDKEFMASLNSKSCGAFNNLSFPTQPNTSFQIVSSNLTLFKCAPTVNPRLPDSHFYYKGCYNFTIFYTFQNITNLPSPPPDCSIVQLPVDTSKTYDDIFELLTAKFFLEVRVWDPCYKCHLKGGRCENGVCFGATIDRVAGHQKNIGLKLGLAIASVLGFVVLMIMVYHFRKSSCWKKETEDSENIEVFLKKHGPLAPKKYRYSEVRKMTDSFKYKLGQGGYGGVFKGKLPDGRFVAVKILNKSKTKGEEFVNEVASIGRTSHVNIVTLLGFCFEGSRRALIYEFLSNGSLEKYIYDENSLKAGIQLEWEILYRIAIGIARGLEYLHRGCNTRILHFDIKSHNILLDENFCPKISDFGLAKICSSKESIVSMVGARGTVGYIAPEVFCRNFGGVSHKSDVYSYGMLVLEMVGGRKNICVGVDNTSEIYFPHWIHKHLELGEGLGLCRIDNEDESQIARKMILVGLWCIQTNPSDRPTMSRAIEMLQGRLESLSFPPKP